MKPHGTKTAGTNTLKQGQWIPLHRAASLSWPLPPVLSAHCSQVQLQESAPLLPDG